MQRWDGKSWRILTGAALVRGFGGPGLNCCVGIFFPAICAEIGLGVGALSLFVSVSALMGLLTLPLGGWLYQKLSPAVVGAVGAILTAVPFAFLSLSRNLFLWCLPAVFFGVGTVLTVNLLGPIVINTTFSNGNSLAMGVMTAIASLVGAVMHPVLTFLTPRFGWRATVLWTGIITAVLMLLCTLLLRGVGMVDAQKTTVRKEAEKDNSNFQKETTGGICRDQGRLPAVALFVFMAVITCFNMFHQHIPTYGRANGIGNTQIGVALAISMCGAACGALLLGFLGEKIGAWKGGLVILGIGVVATLMFLIGGSQVLCFAVAVALHGVVSSGIGVTVPTLTRDFYEGGSYARILARVMMGAPLATIVAMPLYGYLYDKQGTYLVPLLLLLPALLVAALGLVRAARRLT